MELVMVCDYGLDDAAATADIFAHAAEDGWEKIYLVAAGGNVPAEVSLRNAKKLSAVLPARTAVIVDTTGEPQPAEFLKNIHGDDGMGDLFPEAPAAFPVIGFKDFLKTLSKNFVLLSLGPMTLVPQILEKDPQTFVFMGGNIAEEPNFHGYEFNHALNRAAFAECVRHPHIAVTMDTCRHPLFNIQFAALKGDTLQARIVARTRDMTFVSGEKGCYVWDDIAVKVLRHPAWFETFAARDRDGNLLTVARYTGKEDYPALLDR